MKKSTWVIVIYTNDCGDYWWEIYLRSKPLTRFCLTEAGGLESSYTRRDSALRGAKRMAKALRISAEVE